MATIQGTGGAASIVGFNIGVKIDVWSASFVTSTVETTGFGDLGMRVHQPTLLQVNGSFSGTLTDIDAPFPADALGDPGFTADGTKALLNLQATPAQGLAIQSILSNVTITRPEDGKGTVTADFIGTCSQDAAGDMVTQTW